MEIRDLAISKAEPAGPRQPFLLDRMSMNSAHSSAQKPKLRKLKNSCLAAAGAATIHNTND